MSLIRLDCTNRPEDDSIRSCLESIRDQFVDEFAFDRNDESLLCPRLWPTLHYSAFPEQLLLAYEKHRQRSELGHVFQIANRLHDHLDAMVILGDGPAWNAVRAITQICCDPFHNEMTRAARGSKPRVYFSSASTDNDRFRSLLQRLDAGGYSDVSAEHRWGLIANALDPGSDETQQHVYELTLNELTNKILAFNDDELCPRLVTCVGREGNETANRLANAGFPQQLFVPHLDREAFSVLSPIGLLPFAFLGFDCVQLLVGAAEINRHFAETPFEQNLVLQFVAANAASSNAMLWKNETGRRSHSVLASSIGGSEDLVHWLNGLYAQTPLTAHPARIGRRFEAMHSKTYERLLAHQQASDGPSRDEKVTPDDRAIVHHLAVDAIRTDPFPASGASRDASTPPNRAERSLAEIRDESLQALYGSLEHRAVAQTRVRLPVIEMNAIGQWLQMMMLAADMESRWRKMTVQD